MRRHDLVGKYLHWTILKDLGIKVTDSWLQHQPIDTIVHTDTTILWDKPITTHKKVKQNRPDITIHNTKTRECLFIDVAIPTCRTSQKKKQKKSDQR